MRSSAGLASPPSRLPCLKYDDPERGITRKIVCSAANLWGCLTNVLRWGIKEEDAVRAATWNPACAISAEKEVGSIAEGKVADFIVCNRDYTEKRVFLAGRAI